MKIDDEYTGLCEMTVNEVHHLKGEFVDGEMVGGLCRWTGPEGTTIGPRAEDVFFGICK